MTTYSFGSSPNGNDDDDASSSGEIGAGTNWKLCPDECSDHADCASKLGIDESNAYCNLNGCWGGLGGNYLRCFEMNDDEKPCKDRRIHARCTMSNGRLGYCSQYNVPPYSWRAKQCTEFKMS